MSKNQEVIFVDVGDTLIRTFSGKRIPKPNVIAKVNVLAVQEHKLTCWSSDGAAYAREVAKELSIETCFEYFLDKPTVLIDDQTPSEWRN